MSDVGEILVYILWIIS